MLQRHLFIYVYGTNKDGNDIVTGEARFQTLDTLRKSMNASFTYKCGRNIQEAGDCFHNGDVELYLYPTVLNGPPMNHYEEKNILCTFQQVGNCIWSSTAWFDLVRSSGHV